MKIQIWGVRGSIPAPGPETNRYGGNTPCVSVIDGEGHLCIIDMGTGMVPLGMALMSQGLELNADFSAGQGRATILLSHGHWDHIQGFPFFAPVFIPGNQFRVYGNARTANRVESILEGQMNPQFSPIYTLKNLGAAFEFEGLHDNQSFRISQLEIRGMQLPHGETTSLAFRITEQGKSVIYASDVGYPLDGIPEHILDFYSGADLLIDDATYTPEEQEDRRHRGLSSYLDAARAAASAQVGKLMLFHYDQDHSDDRVDENIRLCRQELDRLGAGHIQVIGASEGLELSL